MHACIKFPLNFEVKDVVFSLRKIFAAFLSTRGPPTDHQQYVHSISCGLLALSREPVLLLSCLELCGNEHLVC